jgi:hypothetical protein
MALDSGVVQLLVRMLTPNWSLAVVDVESSGLMGLFPASGGNEIAIIT